VTIQRVFGWRTFTAVASRERAGDLRRGDWLDRVGREIGAVVELPGPIRGLDWYSTRPRDRLGTAARGTEYAPGYSDDILVCPRLKRPLFYGWISLKCDDRADVGEASPAIAWADDALEQAQEFQPIPQSFRLEVLCLEGAHVDSERIGDALQVPFGVCLFVEHRNVPD
jgi:hypothetical protein